MDPYNPSRQGHGSDPSGSSADNVPVNPPGHDESVQPTSSTAGNVPLNPLGQGHSMQPSVVYVQFTPSGQVDAVQPSVSNAVYVPFYPSGQSFVANPGESNVLTVPFDPSTPSCLEYLSDSNMVGIPTLSPFMTSFGKGPDNALDQQDLGFPDAADYGLLPSTSSAGPSHPPVPMDQEAGPSRPPAPVARNEGPNGGADTNEKVQKEHRRKSHVLSEKKRRDSIKHGYEALLEVLPSFEATERSDKTSILIKAAMYIKTLEDQKEQTDKQYAIYMKELIALGIIHQSYETMLYYEAHRDMQSVLINDELKFDIILSIMDELFETFSKDEMPNFDEFVKGVLPWVEEKCDPQSLRATVDRTWIKSLEHSTNPKTGG